MHLISSTFHPPSAVLYSLSCSFRDSDERFLVVLRTDKLHIYVLRPHGTELVCEREIWGLPKGLLQLESSKHLVLALDIPRARILILDFDPYTFEILVHHTSTISPLAHRPSVGFSGILGSNQSVCASFYNGHVKVLEVGSKAPYSVKESDLRVHELTIRTMCFTLPASDSILAIVYTDQNGTAWIIGRSASTMDPSPQLPEKELETVPDLAIPVRIENPSEGDTFGILLVARKLVTFIKPGGDHDTSEDGKQSGKGKGKVRASRSKSEVKAAIQANMVTIEVPFSDVAGWTQVDGTHLVVGDSFGRLYLLTMSMEPEFKMSNVLLGQVSVPSTLSYLSNNILYVGSHSAPSQLVRISEDIATEESSISRGKKKQPDDDTGHIEIMAVHNENIAPIMDATLVDIDGSGQSRIATISGDDSGGWLNVTHKGASFRELAVLPGSANLDNVFPLKKYFDADNHTHLVATTNTATFLLSLSGSDLTLLSPGEIPGISRTGRTILIANVALPGVDAVIHVTPNNATLVDLVTGRGIASWNPPKGDITAAAVDTKLSAVCVATSQGYAYCLSVQPAGLVKASECSFKSQTHSEVSSLAIHGHCVAAAFWGSNDTLLLDFPRLQKLEHTLPSEPSAASNVLLSDFGENQLYLIAARLDGALVIQAVSSDGAPLPGTRRVVPLGGGPIHLTTVPATESSGIRVVAAGKRAVALSVIKKRLSVSALPISDVCAVSAINAPGIGASIVYASVTGLVFGQIEQLDKLNITSFNLGNDSPLRLVHHTDLSAYVVGCMRSGADSIEERHMIRFIDDATFKDLGQVKLKYSEMVTSMTSYAHDGTSCVLVGTGILSSGENEPQAGRIIVFKADSETGMFKLEGSKEVDGAVSSIKQLKGRIIAAINYGVYVFDLTDDESAISEPLAKWERGYIMDDVIVRENLIVVSDKLRSISVLRLIETTDTPESDDDDDEDVDMGGNVPSRTIRLETIAMDMHAVWPTSIELLEDNKTIIAAQLDGNILTWEIDGGNLEPRAAYHIGEIVNRFIALPPKSISGPKPVALFVTNTGRIVALSTVDDNDALQLTRLEMKMGNTVEGLGGVTHAEWRAPKLLHAGVKPPPRRGITDGDFIKSFLEFDPDSAQKILSEGSAAEKIGPAEEEQIRSCLDALVSEQFA